MAATEHYATLKDLDRPIVSTSEAALAMRATASSTSHVLERLGRAGLVSRIKRGLWALDPEHVDERMVLAALTRPYPSYVSMYSALFAHGMIEQIPRITYAVTLGRPHKVNTNAGAFEIRRITAKLFGGFEGSSPHRSGLATPEKALFDTVYLLLTTGSAASLPEIEFAPTFDLQEMMSWVTLVESRRLKTLVTDRLRALVERV